MHTLSLAWDAVWRVMLVGLVLGAGLPTLFAFGIRSMAYGAGGDAEVHAAGTAGPAGHPVGRAIGFLCFAIVLLIVALGIAYIVGYGLGYELSFSNVYPTFEPK